MELMETTVKERLKEFIKHTGLSVNKFEQLCGLGKSYVGNMRVSMQPDKIQKIVRKFPELNSGWLLTGEGEMLRKDSGTRPDEPAAPIIKDAIPLIPMDAFAGYPPQQYSDLPIEDFYQVAEFARADFLIRVKGDSMTPKFNGGDIVACKKIHERLFFQWHRIYVICTNSQGVMIKRVEHSDRQGCIRLVSDNPAYRPFDIPESDISDIALVMGAITLE